MSNKFQQGAPIPESLGAVADQYKEVQDMRLAMQKEVDAVKARETELRDHLIDNLSKGDDTGVAGKRYAAQVKTKRVYNLEDFQKLWPWIVDNERYDMLQKRINEKPVREYVEQTGELVPGMDTMLVPQVSITKIK